MLSRPGVLKEIARRLKDSKMGSSITFEGLFPEQELFVADPSRYIAACCTRRAGKSSALALRFLKTMERHPKSQSLYLSLTQESAKQIMWGVLQEMDEKYKLNLKFTESTLVVSHPNGAKLRLMGADLSNFIRRLRGRKFAGVAIDEAQEFGPHIQALIDDILTPSIADYADGWLAVTGTPGPVPQGLFFEITQNGRFGYSNHKWSILNNPFMPDAAGFIADLKKRREWDDNNPTLLREWKGRWVLDVESLWIRYKESLNNFDKLPPLPGGKPWNYIMGIDFGFKDADAVAVLAWSEHDPATYLVEEIVMAKQGLTELVEQVNLMRAKYDISKIVADEGALGKKLAEEMRRRHNIPVHPAEKARKQETVEFFNDSLRLGKFKAKADSRFAQDSYLIQIDWAKSTPDRITIKKSPHSDIIDAVIYAYKVSPAYTYQKPKDQPKWGTREWAEAQNTEMFEAELEGLTAEWEAAKDPWNLQD